MTLITHKHTDLITYFLLLLALFALTACTNEPPIVEPPPPEPPKPEYIQVAQRDAQIIGQKIWLNEGSGKVENLTAWNKNEEFASLGIGHFIWYPAGKEGPYQEQFPALLDFLQEQKVNLPTWLQQTRDCPWPSRDAFLAAQTGMEMTQLRSLMVQTIPLQVQFIIRRLEQALPTMLSVLPGETQRENVKNIFYRIVKKPNGVYAMLDYINFKGEGTKATERYNGQGWGLLQVFENMQPNAVDVMLEFTRSAEFVLTRRIDNSPPERQESRWLPGWKNRLQTYLQELS